MGRPSRIIGIQFHQPRHQRLALRRPMVLTAAQRSLPCSQLPPLHYINNRLPQYKYLGPSKNAIYYYLKFIIIRLHPLSK